jgi:tetratricopeptide (TPR) repeat protein
VYAIVALAAAAAAGVTVAATALTADHPHAVTATTRLRPGAPPLLLDLGVRTDPEARALRQALTLYDNGKRAEAGAIFRRYHSLEARVGAALSGWPGSLDSLLGLGRANPRSAVVQLHVGLARYWSGDGTGAETAWATAARDGPDTPYGVRAQDLLHPSMPPGLPIFVPSFPSPPELAKLSPPEQLASLERRARAGAPHDLLLYGVALQRLGRPLSAEREFAAAAAKAPHDPEAQVAAAVGRFTKDQPERAFSRLGPLVRVFPKAATVRFHLGLLLVWLGNLDQAETEFRAAYADGPSTVLGHESKTFLDQLQNARTRSRNK